MIIISNKSGQLGNRLFQYSHILANAHENNYSVVNLMFDEYIKFFPALYTIIIPPQSRKQNKKSTYNKLKFKLAYYLDRIIFKFFYYTKWQSSIFHKIFNEDLNKYNFSSSDFYDLNSKEFQEVAKSKKIVFAYGRFFRDYSNLYKHSNYLRILFKPTDSIVNNVNTLLTAIRKENKLVIGVHMRRGDYKEFADGRYYYSFEQYASILKNILAIPSLKDKKIAFLLCSNEPIPLTAFRGMTIYTGSGQLVEDMYALASCNYIIGPPSTFTMWASFYGNLPMLQLKDLSKQINIEDFKLLPPEIGYNYTNMGSQ